MSASGFCISLTQEKIWKRKEKSEHFIQEISQTTQPARTVVVWVPNNEYRTRKCPPESDIFSDHELWEVSRVSLYIDDVSFVVRDLDLAISSWWEKIID